MARRISLGAFLWHPYSIAYSASTRKYQFNDDVCFQNISDAMLQRPPRLQFEQYQLEAESKLLVSLCFLPLNTDKALKNIYARADHPGGMD